MKNRQYHILGKVFLFRDRNNLKKVFKGWKYQVETGKYKKSVLENLLNGQWQQTSEKNAKRRVFWRIKEVIQKKETEAQNYHTQKLSGKAFRGWVEVYQMFLRHKKIINLIQLKIIKRYLKALREYKDQCIMKESRRLTADKYYRKNTKEKLYWIWRKK